MSWGYYPKYVPVAKKQADAKKALNKLLKQNPNIHPIVIE